MKRVYSSVYEFIWFCISKHCSRLFALQQANEPLSSKQSSNIWLEEIALVVQDKLESVKEKRCLIRLVRAYVFSIKTFNSVRHEVMLRDAKEGSSTSLSNIRIGKILLVLFLAANSFVGIWITYNYQAMAGQFSFAATLIAMLSYFSVAWCIFAARALPQFKLTLVILIAFTSLNTLFWKLWQTYINSAGDCYSEVCMLIAPESIFQSTTIKPSIILFWLIFLMLLSFKNPITNYLTFKKSNNRSL